MSGQTTGDALPIATRAWMEQRDPDGEERSNASPSRTWTPDQPPGSRWRRSVLILDTETTTEPTQRLTFGCYRFGLWQADGTLTMQEEGIFFADDLPERDPDGYAVLQTFVRNHQPETEGFYRNRRLMLRSRRDFLDTVLWPAVRDGALIVGLNLPFDLSRLACDVTAAKGKRFQGGFSFVLWEYQDEETGAWKVNKYRPRLCIKQIDSKRSLIDVTRARKNIGQREKHSRAYRPGFLDLRTLAFALTGRGHSLRSACDAFGVAGGKVDAGEHGRITPEYIAYARQDVAATAALLVALRADYDRHPIALDPCKAYSPASIAKAYYRAMGIVPRLTAQPDFPPEYLGYAMSAYYGGRAECAIRRTPVPVVYTDVLSMYPTVNALLDLWRFHIADRIEIEDCTEEARAVLDGVTPETIRDPETWPALAYYGLIVPDGDILPVRAQYAASGGTFIIGVNPFHDGQPYWYAGPDLAASVLLTGKVPRIVRAFRPVPKGRQTGLQTVALRGTVPVDPVSGDFFRTVIEERKRAKVRADISPEERSRLDRFLKVLANSGSYGVFVESNPQELSEGETAKVAIYGPDDSPFSADALRPESPGVYSFPPVAALITAGARLVLALIERMLTGAGGTHAFCDTDSMAIVASEHGGLIPCDGGPHRLPDGRDAIRALSWADVDRITGDLATLNPYDPDAVPGSILKIEDVNYNPETMERRQIWCLSIAAKRYALFTISESGEPSILPGSTRHGLGYLIDLRSPVDADDTAKVQPSGEMEKWEHALWDGIVRGRLGLAHESPPWANRPAAMRHTISTPFHLDAFATFDKGKPYADCIKPFSFMLAVSLADQGRPHGIDSRAPFHLVTAFESNPRRWTLRTWFDLHGGERFDITTAFPGGGQGVAGVKSLGMVAGRYAFHPETKRNGPDGQPCAKRTEGMLSRRPVRGAGLVCIGKEAHRLEERDLMSGLDDVQGIYRDSRREPWTTAVLPGLRAVAGEPAGHRTLEQAANLKPRALRDVLAGRSRPRPHARTALVALIPHLPLEPRTCARCGRAMADPHPRRRFCSATCRSRAYEARRIAAMHR